MNANAAVPAPTGWTQIFADDFTGAANSRVGGNWRYDTGTGYPGGPQNGFGTSEAETMTDSSANVAQDGSGNLKITALRGGPTGWTSGRIETNRDDFRPPAGGKLRVEARLRLPQTADPSGYWPAFWMLGTPYRANPWGWPGVGEIDIMENVNGLNRE
ncbi:MAG: 1,3-beta-glucanase, partial [Catenulispora sp.]